MASLRPSPVDAPDAHALLSEYFAARAADFPGQAYRTTFPEPSAFVAPHGRFLVLDDDTGQAVGCGGIRLISPADLGARYEVKHLFLRPETRGRGWGRLLLDALITQARQWDAAELVLDTHHSLEAAAGLYTRAGFVPIERYNDNPNATRWYGRGLSPHEG